MEDLLARINQLSNKEKTEPLTAEEKAEQKDLRQQYVKLFRQGLRNQLDNTKIKDVDGNITPLKRKKK